MNRSSRRRPGARATAAILVAALCGACAHAIKSVSDCDRAPTEQRVACAACTVKNEAGGLMGEYEYRPDNDASNRCVKVN